MQAASASTDRPRVLLIEDDAELRSLLTKGLRQRGCEVIEASTGSVAIEYVVYSLIYELVRPALIVSDIRLQSGNGLRIAEAVRTADYEVPILLMTAFPGPEVEARAAAIPDCTLLAKPFDLFEFFGLVGQLISGAPKRCAAVAG